MRELLTVEEFFVESFDLICRYVGENIVVKVRLVGCRDYFVPDRNILEKYLLKSITPLRDLIYQDGGKLAISVHPFMYLGFAVRCRAMSKFSSRAMVGANLLISREILSLTQLTKLARSEMIIVSQ